MEQVEIEAAKWIGQRPSPPCWPLITEPLRTLNASQRPTHICEFVLRNSTVKFANEHFFDANDKVLRGGGLSEPTGAAFWEWLWPLPVGREAILNTPFDSDADTLAAAVVVARKAPLAGRERALLALRLNVRGRSLIVLGLGGSTPTTYWPTELRLVWVDGLLASTEREIWLESQFRQLWRDFSGTKPMGAPPGGTFESLGDFLLSLGRFLTDKPKATQKEAGAHFARSETVDTEASMKHWRKKFKTGSWVETKAAAVQLTQQKRT